ncbi:MAG: VTT domain-containing protein [Spirochaetia bacterium]
MSISFEHEKHYTHRNQAESLSFFPDSASYYAALSNVFTRAQHRILIVGWGVDDRIYLVRSTTPSGSDSATGSLSLGELLIQLAEDRPSLQIQLCAWRSPAFFSADHHISDAFQKAAARLPNLTLSLVPTASGFNSRHEKYVIVDDVLAFIGGIDLTHNRWDTEQHAATHEGRVNPAGESYTPYHDMQVALSGPIVHDLYTVAAHDLELHGEWSPVEQPLWPEGLEVDARKVPVMLALTRSNPNPELDNTRQIKDAYHVMINNASKFIYIEDQYFSSDSVTQALSQQLQREDGPEVIVIMARELPDALGRLTMGVNASMHLARLMESDLYGRLGVFNMVSPDDPNVDVKVHSKLMIVDGRYLTIGSANINQRSFNFDLEANIILDSQGSDTPGFVQELEDRVLAQRAGLNVGEWLNEVRQNAGSKCRAMHERVHNWDGLQQGRNFLAPGTVPHEVMDYFDMAHAPQPESVLHKLARSSALELSSRAKKVILSVAVVVGLIGAVFLLSRTDIRAALDININFDEVMRGIDSINDNRPVTAGLLTVGIFWLAISMFVTIAVPIVFFSAVHGPWLGILYSIIGVLSGAAIYYTLGLVLHDSKRLGKVRAVRRAKEQLEKIKPYGTWAVAISRMVPTGPFLVVNFVTGAVGFTPRQFVAGSLIGLLPGIFALSLFGEAIRNVFTDPDLVSVGVFILMVAAYFLIVNGALAAIKKIAGWAEADDDAAEADDEG